jgi:hypothetical protein
MEIDVHALLPLQRPVGGVSHGLGSGRRAGSPQLSGGGTRVGLSYTLVPQPNTLPPPQTPQGHQQTQPSVCVVRGWPDPARAPAPHMASLAVNLLGLVRAQPELLPLPMRQRVRRGEAGCIGCGRAPPPPVCRRCAAPRAARAARPHRPCLWPAQPSYIRGPALPGMPVCTAGLADGVRACLRKTCKPDGFPWHKQGRGAARVPPAAHAPARFTYFVCDRARCPLRGVVRSGVRW